MKVVYTWRSLAFYQAEGMSLPTSDSPLTFISMTYHRFVFLDMIHFSSKKFLFRIYLISISHLALIRKAAVNTGRRGFKQREQSEFDKQRNTGSRNVGHSWVSNGSLTPYSFHLIGGLVVEQLPMFHVMYRWTHCNPCFTTCFVHNVVHVLFSWPFTKDVLTPFG